MKLVNGTTAVIEKKVFLLHVMNAGNKTIGGKVNMLIVY